MFKYLRLIGFSYILSIITGCVSPGGITAAVSERPLLELQKIAAASLPLGLRSSSPNGRELNSQYFIAENSKFKPAESANERKFAQIIVLGDQRPYKIQVYVYVEKRGEGSGSPFIKMGTDLSLAQVVARRFQNQLTKRRDDLNVIDDFRVF